MLRSAKSLMQHKIRAIDGVAGQVCDLYFDDSTWHVRHIVVDTGMFLWRHKVLLAPEETGKPDWVNQIITTSLTREEIKAKPRIDVDKPVYRQMQDQLRNFYEWAPHWTPGSGMPEPETEMAPTGDIHLRSVRHLLDGKFETADGFAGHVVDFIINDDSWEIEMLAVEMEHQFRVQTLALPAEIVSEILWDQRHLKTRLNSAMILNAPEYNPLELMSEDYLRQVHEFQERFALRK